MSINVNTKNYDSAREYLATAASPLNDISLDIATAIQNLDNRIIPYVIEDYNYVNNQIKNVYASNEILSTEIENFKQKCKSIEDKATGAISTKKEAQLTSLSAETSETLTAQLLQVEEQAVIQNHIDNQEIAYLTSTYVSDPTSTLSYETTYVDEITAAADADIAATGAENGGKSESFWGKVGNFFKGIGSYVVDSIVHPFKTLVKTGASIVNFAVGLINGVLNFVEALVDCVALIVSAAASIFTGLYDLCQWIGGKITGNEDWESATKKMWGGVMKFVATKWVDKAFNGFYENTAVGKWLDEQAYGPFKHTGGMYSFSKGVGYVVGVVILTIVTYGIGGAAAGAGGAAGSAGSAAAGSATSSVASTAAAVFTTKSGAALLGAVGAAAGTGKNTQNAWADGASLGEGLTYGVAMGAYEGLQFYGGARINMLKVPGATGVKGQVLNSGLHVALDTADGASSGFIDPLMKMIYTPNEQNMEQIMYYVNYDENGNQIDNKTWDELTFGQKYKALFEYNGGWKTVGTNAALAGVLSTITEVPDIAAAIKTPKVDLGTTGKEAVESGLKTTDVDTGVAKQLTDGSETAVKQTGASWTTKVKDGAVNVKNWIQEKSGAAWARGKAAWTSTKEWFSSKFGTKQAVEAGGAVKAVDAIDEAVAKTGAKTAEEARSSLKEALKTKSPKAIKNAAVDYVKASYNAFREKIAKAIDSIPGVKKVKEIKKTTTDKVASIKKTATDKFNEIPVVKGYKKAKQTVVDGFNNLGPVKKFKEIRKTTKKGYAYVNAGPVLGPKLSKSLDKLSELYKVDKTGWTAAQLADWTKQVAEQKDIISKLRIKKTDLETIIDFDKQVEIDMILLTDKMKSVLKTDKMYLTNEEILARVEQSSLDEFIKYCDSLPNMTPAKYAKVYKKFIGCLGLTAAGYFVINGDFKD